LIFIDNNILTSLKFGYNPSLHSLIALKTVGDFVICDATKYSFSITTTGFLPALASLKH